MVTKSEENLTNTKREGTERRKRRNRKEIITETEQAPRSQHLIKVISRRLKLRFVCAEVACRFF